MISNVKKRSVAWLKGVQTVVGLFIVMGWATFSAASPDIQFINIPPSGNLGSVHGQATGVDFNHYHVAVYMYKPGIGWCSATSNALSLDANGKWSFDYADSPADATAVVGFAAFLVPKHYTPPAVSGDDTLPHSLYVISEDRVEKDRTVVGEWLFDNYSAQDSSGNNQHGSIQGAVGTMDRFGNRNSAFYFDGVDDFIDCGTAPALNMGNDFTVEFWINGTMSGQRDPVALLSKGHGNGFTGWVIQRVSWEQNGLLQFGGGVGSGWTYSAMCPLSSLLNYADAPFGGKGQWHHVVVTKSSTAGSCFYVDGVAQTPESRSTASFANPERYHFVIGRDCQNGGRNFRGVLDDVRVYNRVVSAGEIRRHYNEWANPSEWRFNSNAGDAGPCRLNANIQGAVFTGDRYYDAGDLSCSNSALYFDGVDDLAVLCGEEQLDYLHSFSMVFWVKGVATQPNTITAFISKGHGRSGCTGWTMQHVPSEAGGDIQFGGGWGGGWMTSACAKWTNVLDNTWHMIAVTRSPSSSRIYVDGGAYLNGTPAVRQDFSRPDWYPLVIGADAYNGQRNFRGKLDDVRIYGGILNASEINALYASEQVKGDALLVSPMASNEYPQWTSRKIISYVDWDGAAHSAYVLNNVLHDAPAGDWTRETRPSMLKYRAPNGAYYGVKLSGTNRFQIAAGGNFTKAYTSSMFSYQDWNGSSWTVSRSEPVAAPQGIDLLFAPVQNGTGLWGNAVTSQQIQYQDWDGILCTAVVVSNRFLTAPENDWSRMANVGILKYSAQDGSRCSVMIESDGFYFLRAVNSDWSAMTRSTSIGLLNHDGTVWAIGFPQRKNLIPGLGYVQQWSDEFTQPAINTNYWNFDIGRGPGNDGWGNGEKQYYTSNTNNIRTENGKLVMTARCENYGGCSYTSARLTTRNKVSARYGIIEARIKAPANAARIQDPGAWPAFWMMGTNYPVVGWPACGELDIWESGGLNPKLCSGSSHWKTAAGTGDYGHQVSSADNLCDDFHTYTVKWDTKYIEWYLDGSSYGTIYHAGIPEGTPFNRDFYLLLNLAVGGRWNYVGVPAPTNYPQQMLVDWIRVWQPGL